MEIYNKEDVERLAKEEDMITEKIAEKKYQLMEPKLEEIITVHKLLLNFIKEKKRKIYGGYALNMLLSQKSPEDMLYKPPNIPELNDIDIYSPFPIQDVYDFCNLLHAKGFKYIRASEAQHKETYMIHVNSFHYCDLSYVPKNIYDRMPAKPIDGVYVTDPKITLIDYFRILSDPMTSYWKIHKVFKRMYLLQKFWPAEKISYQVIPDPIYAPDVLKDIYNFLVDRRSVIVIGYYAYNHLLEECGTTKFKPIKIPRYEFISTNYKDDCIELIKSLQSKYKNITIKEYLPFFQFNGYSCTIYIDNEIVACIYTDNGKCIPYKHVSAIDYNNDSKTKPVKYIQIGTFSVIMMFNYIWAFQNRVCKLPDRTKYYETIISNIIEMKKEYFKKTKQTIFDESLFQEFSIQCVGEAISPERERTIRYSKKKGQGKRANFSYDPSDSDGKGTPSDFKFSNSSGNEINNEHNFKIIPFLDPTIIKKMSSDKNDIQ